MDALQDIVRFVEPAGDDIFFFDIPSAGIHVYIHNGVGGDERGISQAQQVGVELRVPFRVDEIRLFRELHIPHFFHTICITDPNLLQTAFSFDHNDMVLECLHAFHQGIFAMGEDIHPVLFAGRIDIDHAQFEILCIVVVDDKEFPFVMVGAVIQSLDACLKNAQFTGRVIRIHKADFARVRGEMIGGDKSIIAGFVEEQKKGFVCFFQDQNILFGVAADHMPEQFIGAQCVIQCHVENGLIVVRPFDPHPFIGAAQHIANRFWVEAAACQVFDVERVYLPAFEIRKVGEFAAIGAGLKSADTAKGFSLCQLILIQKDLFGRIEGIFFTAQDGILFALFMPLVVEVIASLLRDACICFFDPALHLGEERFLQRFGVLHYFFKIIAFGVQVLQRFGVVSIAHPVIIVDAGDAVIFQFVRAFGGNGSIFLFGHWAFLHPFASGLLAIFSSISLSNK